MKLLIAHGADPELTDDFNGTALSHAVSQDFADGVRRAGVQQSRWPASGDHDLGVGQRPIGPLRQ